MTTEVIDYDISIIMPYFKKLREFSFTLPINYNYFSQNGVEIILVVDEPLTKETFDFLNNYPKLKYKIIVNNQPHEWRNPAKVINVGIRNSNKTFVLVMSPETIFINNAIDIFRKAYRPKTFLLGYVCFSTLGEYAGLAKNNFNMKYKNYGSIFVRKNDLINVGGYNEDFICWGGEDDEIRARLIKNKYDRLIVNAKMVHIDLEQRANKIKLLLDTDKKKQYFMQKKYIKNLKKINFDDNGWDFKDILVNKTDPVMNLNFNFSYNNENITINANYLIKNSLIEDYKFGKLLKKNYSIMNLLPIYNEEQNIPNYFNSIFRLADGIIILDDGSTDNSWNTLDNYDYTLKVKLKRKVDVFNDLKNRNILLELLEKIFLDNFIDIRWVIWLDCDEIIGNDDAELLQIKNYLKNSGRDLCTIEIYHMWNETHYNTQYPKSENGKKNFYRLFKIDHRKRPFKIVSNKILHFPLIPFATKKKGHIGLRIKHYGMSTSEKRKKKYLKYIYVYDKERKNQKSYEHIIKENPILKKF